MARGKRRLGSRYVLKERIGQGTVGEVWRASVEGERAHVAVKLLRADLRSDPELVARFLQERSVMLELRHSHVVGVRDLVAEGDRLAIVMDLVEGHDLRHLMRQQRTLPPALACTLASQVAAGLAAAHAAGVVHRDLKPENVLLAYGPDEVPVARVSDFGLAKVLHGTSVTRLTQAIGTPGYMAPELGSPGPRTGAIDVYALGVMLYELLSGRRPFDGDHPLAVLRAHAEEAPARPAGLPNDLWDLLSACMAKDPNERPAAVPLADRLTELASGLQEAPALTPEQASTTGTAASLAAQPTKLRARQPAPSSSPTGAADHRRWRRRHNVLILSAALVVVVTGAGLWAKGAADGGLTMAAAPATTTVHSTITIRTPRATTSTTELGTGNPTPTPGPVPSPPSRTTWPFPPTTLDGPSTTRPPQPPVHKPVVMYSVWKGKAHPHGLGTYQWAGQQFIANGPVLRTIRLNLGYNSGHGDVTIFLFHGRHDHEDRVATRVVPIKQNAATEANFTGIRLQVGDRYVVQVFLHEAGAVYLRSVSQRRPGQFVRITSRNPYGLSAS